MEKSQPTPINKDEYKEFKQFVADVHGSTRGHLRTEIENALRQYRKSYYGDDRLHRIEQDISTIMATVADAESDGGVVAPIPSEPSNTHAREITKPAANQPRSQKVEYLVERYIEKEDCTKSAGKLVHKTVEKLVDDEYSFKDEIMAEYVEAVFSKLKTRFNARRHPVHGSYHVWGEELEAAKQEAESMADDNLGELE